MRLEVVLMRKILYLWMISLAFLLVFSLAPYGLADAYEKPQIDIIEPARAPIGSEITINGAHFGDMREGSRVVFGSVEATQYIRWSDSQIKVIVPYGSYPDSQLQVKVITPGGSSYGARFELEPRAMVLAEGFTGKGFQEYIILGNPQAFEVKVKLLYIFADGTYMERGMIVPPQSRVTVDVNRDVGEEEEVSALIFSDIYIVVERPIYFDYRGWTGGHNIVAGRKASKTWYFAEGSTEPGFDEYLAVLNPTEKEANLVFRFQIEDAGEIFRYGSVPAYSRKTFKLNDLLGSGCRASLALKSDQFVVAERSMYFGHEDSRSGGHCEMGLPGFPSSGPFSYYFAEGSTFGGFDEYLILQNPDSAIPVVVDVTYRFRAGQGDPIRKQYRLEPGQRRTIFLPDDVGRGKDVSVALQSDSPFVAERSIFYRYDFSDISVYGGDCIVGARKTSLQWYFSEGFTGPDFHEWLSLFNPGEEDSLVEVTYFTPSGVLHPARITVPAGSRETFMVNDHAGRNILLSCQIRVISGPGIVAERPMYFRLSQTEDGDTAVEGGHTSLGDVPYAGDALEDYTSNCCSNLMEALSPFFQEKARRLWK